MLIWLVLVLHLGFNWCCTFDFGFGWWCLFVLCCLLSWVCAFYLWVGVLVAFLWGVCLVGLDVCCFAFVC